MRSIFLVLLLLTATATAAAFYFGLCTVAAERDESTFVLRLAGHPDVLIPTQENDYAEENANQYGFQARGRIASVDPAKNRFVLTENIKNLTFRVSNDTMIVINGQPGKLAELNGGDEATVIYTKQGQILYASVVNCTRKALTP